MDNSVLPWCNRAQRRQGPAQGWTRQGEAKAHMGWEGERDSTVELPVGVGDELGAYELVSLIGRGGMGAVFGSRHSLLHRPAAVKVLYTALLRDPEYISRFLFEARIVNQIRHPNIVETYDFIDIREPKRVVAYVMELLSGSSLDRVLSEYRLNSRQTQRIGIQIADALKAVHKAGVIHRDLKPENIFLVDGYDTPSAKILDFGIAKSTQGSADHITQTGVIMGTPAFMAPEQVLGGGVTSSVDIYATTGILYQALSGNRMFDGPPLEVLRAKLAREAPKIKLPQDVEHREEWTDLIYWGASIEPRHRPSADELVDALASIGQQETLGSVRPAEAPTTKVAPTQPPNRRAVWLLASALGAVTAFTIAHARSDLILTTTVPLEPPVSNLTSKSRDAEEPHAPSIPLPKEFVKPQREKGKSPTGPKSSIYVGTNPQGAVVFDVKNGLRKLGTTPLHLEREWKDPRPLRIEKTGCTTRHLDAGRIRRGLTLDLDCSSETAIRESTERLHSINSERTERELEWARDLYERGRYREALPLFERAYKDSLHRPDTILGLARCEQKLNLYARALKHYNEYQAVAPNLSAGQKRILEDSLRFVEMMLGSAH